MQHQPRLAILVLMCPGFSAIADNASAVACGGAGGDFRCSAGGSPLSETADYPDQTSLLQAREAWSLTSKCGSMRRRRRESTCSCRRRNGVGAADSPDLACVNDTIKKMPRRRDGFIDLDVMLKWIYQEPIVVNLMHLPVVACQDRTHVFFNCQVLQPNQAVSISSSLPYTMYAVLGTAKPSNWENLRDVLGPMSKLMGPVAVLAAAYTGGVSVAAYTAVQQLVQKTVMKTTMSSVAGMLGEHGAEEVLQKAAPQLGTIIQNIVTKGITGTMKDAAIDGLKEAAVGGVSWGVRQARAVDMVQNLTATVTKENPGLLSVWSSMMYPNEKHLKIVGGMGGDQEQDSPEAVPMRIEVVSKEEFAKLSVEVIFPEP